VVSGKLDAALGIFPSVPSGIEGVTLFEDDFAIPAARSWATPARSP
jgi:hypothetical protein